MILIRCHPQSIKELPQYGSFMNAAKDIKNLDIPEEEKRQRVRALENFHGIKLVTQNCNDECPYHKMCAKETAKIREELRSTLLEYVWMPQDNFNRLI